jgi:membrane protease YdiL (CAAX protease family)
MDPDADIATGSYTTRDLRFPWPTPRPFGFWETIGYAVVICAVACYFSFLFGTVAQLGLGDYFASILMDEIGSGSKDLNLRLPLGLISASTGLFLFLVEMVLLYTLLSHRGFRVWRYLGLDGWPGRSVLWHLAGAACVGLALHTLYYLLTGALGWQWLKTQYLISAYPPMLGVAIVVFGPIVEELLFRGFLFRGVAHSRAGPYWAIAVTAALWALAHSNRGFFGVCTTFLMGVYLGWLRRKTGSVVPTILLHVLWNALAFAAVAIGAEYMQ